jgi:hypothetical protein
MDKRGQLRIGIEKRPVDDLIAYLDYKIREGGADQDRTSQPLSPRTPPSAKLFTDLVKRCTFQPIILRWHLRSI